MRSMRMRRALATWATALMLLEADATASSADGPVSCWTDLKSGQEICEVVAGGDPAPSGSTSGTKSKRAPTCTAKAAYPPNSPVPCEIFRGSWSQSLQCYLKLSDPQPSTAGPKGEKRGAYYNCYELPDYLGHYEWLTTPPRVLVDPEAVARQIVRRMALRRVDLGLAPKPGPNSRGLVGLPVYMWVDRPTPETIGPISRSASSGGVNVTATARVKQLVWSMGDGHTVTCTGAGTPYQDSFGARPSPTCGYTYLTTSQGRPDNAYTVAATSNWRVEWTGAGESGWFEFSFTATGEIRIGEVQALG